MSRSTLTLSSILVLLCLFLAISLVSGNNLSACVGTAIGSGIVSRRFALGLGAGGFILGIFAQGQNMVKTARVLLPVSDPLTITLVLFAIVLVFSFGKIIRVPLSVTMSLVGLMIGVSIVRGLAVDRGLIEVVVGAWFAAPIAAVTGTFCLIRAMNRAKPKNIWRRVQTYKTLLIALSFLSAYVMGTNSLALIVAVAGFGYAEGAVAVLGILFGSLFFSRGQIKRVGEDIFSLRYSNALATLIISTILFEVATLLFIPLSSTQTLSSGVFGAGISYPRRYISIKPFLVIVIGWVVAPLLSLGIGVLI